MPEFGSSQHVSFPTRQSNILDLIMTNKEFSVGDLKSCPGVSDNDKIFFNFFVKPEKLVSRARKIYLSHNADLARVKKGINDVPSEVFSRQTYNCVDNLWSFFKNTLHKLTDKFSLFIYAKSNSNLKSLCFQIFILLFSHTHLE